MATAVPKLSSGGAVKIRCNCLDRGTTKWREGSFEILEKDNKVSLCLRFNCERTKTFQVRYYDIMGSKETKWNAVRDAVGCKI